MSNEEFREYALALMKKNLKRYQEITNISKVSETGCEWCDNKTKVIHITHTPQIGDTGTVSTIFEDDHFHLQGEWWVCGQCKDS